MGKIGTFFVGSAAGFLLAALVGAGVVLVVINVLIPWEEICAAVGPMQTAAREGRQLIATLTEWLERAEGFLAIATDAPSELGGSLSGILDRVGEIAGGAASLGLDILTAPLEALIDVAKSALGATEGAVKAAENVLASVDESRCN